MRRFPRWAATDEVTRPRIALGRVAARWAAGIVAARRRSELFDHLWRARERYREVHGSRLAAAIAYYGFFAVFALAALVFAVLGFALKDNGPVVRNVQAYLQHNLPQLSLADVGATSGRVGTVAVAGLVLAGLAWVQALRSSQRAVWGLKQQPGNRAVRWLVDLAVLVGLGVLLILSVSISAGIQRVLPVPGKLSWVTNLGALADLVLAAALLAWVPRLRMPLRRLVPSALMIAFGMALLKTIGRMYITHAQHNPAYRLVAGAAGLLIFIYLFNRVLLFAAALAATSGYGTVTDLAGGRRPVMAALNHHAEEQVTAKQVEIRT